MADTRRLANGRSLFYEMLRIRTIEEKIAALYVEQEMRCPVHLCIGQEAVAVGVCANLANTDYAMSGHRSHGHYLAKGGNLQAMLAELYGKATGCARGKGGSMHLIDLSVGFLGCAPIVGSTIPIGVGIGFGTMMREEQHVSVVFLGEGATEEGVFHESLNFAALKCLPVVFVCENNLYSVYSPLSVRQPETRDLGMIVRGHGVLHQSGNGNNIQEVYDLSGEAIALAREGKGPTVLEFATYRWREHCGPYYDNDIGYRKPEEFETWKTRCPVERQKNTLSNADMLNEQDMDEMVEKIDREIEAALKFVQESPFPTKEMMLEDIYA